MSIRLCLYPDDVDALGDGDPCADSEDGEKDDGEIEHTEDKEGEVAFDAGEKADFAVVAECFGTGACVADHKGASECENG